MSDTEARHEGNVEATVPVKKGRVVPIPLHPFLIGKKHGNASSIFACGEDLLGTIGVMIEMDGRLEEQFALASLEIVPVR